MTSAGGHRYKEVVLYSPTPPSSPNTPGTICGSCANSVTKRVCICMSLYCTVRKWSCECRSLSRPSGWNSGRSPADKPPVQLQPRMGVAETKERSMTRKAESRIRRSEVITHSASSDQSVRGTRCSGSVLSRTTQILAAIAKTSKKIVFPNGFHERAEQT
jgi:hypothetical protein